MSVCVPHPNFGCLIWHCALFRQNASRVYASGPGPWEVSPASSGMLRIVTPSMSMEEHISQLTAQVVALQAQLACCSWSPPPPQPSTAQPPPLKPPKVSAPSPFSGVQDDLDCFKAKCSLYLSMTHSEFPDERSNILF